MCLSVSQSVSIGFEIEYGTKICVSINPLSIFLCRWKSAVAECSPKLAFTLCLHSYLYVGKLITSTGSWPWKLFTSDQMTIPNKLFFVYNMISSLSCSFSAYWLSYVDHPCLLAPETFDIRFARIPIRQDCKKVQHVLDSWEVWNMKKWERKIHLTVKCTFWLEHNCRKYELSEITLCQWGKREQIRMRRMPVGFISMHAAVNIEQQEN